LAVLEAGVEVDEEYVAVGYEEFVHGEAYLDVASLCRFLDGTCPPAHPTTTHVPVPVAAATDII
jgi:hypothetical protein